ncbi:hypothetical protein G9A89_012545 [Geosiphon pyriformis]|nr:hypothetical protein G9A89_012545 [Geosiphon pyriformis]
MSHLLPSFQFLPEGALAKWIGFIALISAANSVQNLFTLELTKRVYNRRPEEITGVSSRTFATWTFTTAVVRLYTAYNITNKAVYQIAIWTYLIALLHFTSEWQFYKTSKFGPGLSAPLFVACVPVMTPKEPPTIKLSSSFFLFRLLRARAFVSATSLAWSQMRLTMMCTLVDGRQLSFTAAADRDCVDEDRIIEESHEFCRMEERDILEEVEGGVAFVARDLCRYTGEELLEGLEGRQLFWSIEIYKDMSDAARNKRNILSMNST